MYKKCFLEMSGRKNSKLRETGRFGNASNNSPLRIARRKEAFPPVSTDEPCSSENNQPVKILYGNKIKIENDEQPKNEASSSSKRLLQQNNTQSMDDKLIKEKEKSSHSTSTKQRDATFPDIKLMADALRLIDDDDNMNFLDFCKEFILDSNKNFTVIGAIGAQGTGKSTLLSMLAGNDSLDMYRQYVFRPCSREGVESSRYQTTKIYVYISKWRTIFLDCQGMGNSSLFEEYVRSHRRQNQPAEQFELASLQLLTLMVNICHTLFLCVNWFIDTNVMRDLLRTEVFLPLEMSAEIINRKVNIVVVHNRAKAEAFKPLVVAERMRVLKGMFENSKFNVCGGINMVSMGFERYRLIDSDVNYVLLSEIKMKKTAQHAPDSEVINNTIIDYGRVISILRTKILELPRPSFSNSTTEPFTEQGWFQFVVKFWDKILKELQNSFDETKSTESSRFRRYSSRHHDHLGLSSTRRRRTSRKMDDPSRLKSPSLHYESSQNVPLRILKNNSGRVRHHSNKLRKVDQRGRRHFLDSKEVLSDEVDDNGREKRHSNVKSQQRSNDMNKNRRTKQEVDNDVERSTDDDNNKKSDIDVCFANES